MLRHYEADQGLVVWWASRVECMSALARREREGTLDGSGVAEAVGRLNDLADWWQEVEPVETVRRTAMRILRVHPLRAADAFQLAAALIACEGHPATLPFVALDDRLTQAAEREGFPIVTESSG